jgi:hypothetical protein
LKAVLAYHKQQFGIPPVSLTFDTLKIAGRSASSCRKIHRRLSPKLLTMISSAIMLSARCNQAQRKLWVFLCPQLDVVDGMFL